MYDHKVFERQDLNFVEKSNILQKVTEWIEQNLTQEQHYQNKSKKIKHSKKTKKKN